MSIFFFTGFKYTCTSNSEGYIAESHMELIFKIWSFFMFDSCIILFQFFFITICWMLTSEIRNWAWENNKCLLRTILVHRIVKNSNLTIAFQLGSQFLWSSWLENIRKCTTDGSSRVHCQQQVDLSLFHSTGTSLKLICFTSLSFFS